MCLVLGQLLILGHYVLINYFQDPTNQLLHLAETKGMGSNFNALSLGQGQAPIATRLIKEGIREVCMIVVSDLCRQ